MRSPDAQDQSNRAESRRGGRSSTPDRKVLHLAVPAIGNGMTLLLYSWVDTWWVGRTENPDTSLASLSIATFHRVDLRIDRSPSRDMITVSISAVRIPLVYWTTSSTDYGVEGNWWAISLTAIARGLVMAYCFQRGTWMRHSV